MCMEGKNIIVTGAAGFVGSNFIELLYEKYNNINITVIDKLTYAADKSRLKEFDDLRFIEGDIKDRNTVQKAFSKKDIDFVVNFAAESHVDRSIDS